MWVNMKILSRSIFAEKKLEIAQIQLFWNRLPILGQAPGTAYYPQYCIRKNITTTSLRHSCVGRNLYDEVLIFTIDCNCYL